MSLPQFRMPMSYVEALLAEKYASGQPPGPPDYVAQLGNRIGGYTAPDEWHDVAHQAEYVQPDSFVVTSDGTGIFKAGYTFERHDMGYTLYNSGWPLGIVFLNLRDGELYTVREWRKSKYANWRQALVNHKYRIVPTRNNNGGMRRERI